MSVDNDNYEKGKQVIGFMTQTLKDELDRRFLEVEREDLYRIYLDPRYKAKYFPS